MMKDSMSQQKPTPLMSKVIVSVLPSKQTNET